MQSKQQAKNHTSADTVKNPLYIVNGKKYNEHVDTIDPNKIATINAWKDKDAIGKYDQRERYGVVQIKLKKTEEPVEPRTSDNIFFQ